VVCDLVRELGGGVVISRGGRMVGRIEAAGGRHIALDLKSKNPLTYFMRARKLRKILRAENPDLVCAHSRVPAWLFVWANRGLGLKWITYAHGANSVSRYSEVMTKGDLVIVPSRFLADYLKTNYALPESRIRVIPNAVDAARFDPDNLDQAFIAEKRREWGIREGDRVIMAIGRITPVKGLEGLIRNFSTLTSDQEIASPLKLVIVGGADKHHLRYLESLEKLASAVRLSPSPIVFAGPQEKIPECISIADEIVSANTTKPETFGLSGIEAYAMNKPVKAKRFGGVAEVMEAVEKAGKPTLREAVKSLYSFELQRERTLAAYREALDMV
jgi:glycosyltransferase involved in cell wall biosynthesis